MATTQAATPISGSRAEAPAKLEFNPIKYWAFAGALITAFMAYVMLRWITGPYFEKVDPGPTPLPTWMKVSLVAWQVILPSIWGYWLYRFVIKPWRAERRIPVDGLILLAATTIVFQDGITNWSAQWITYNTWLVNWGSWYNDLPGWMAYGEPGAMVPEPPLFIPFAHGFAWLAFAMIGRKFINFMRARRPGVGYPSLLIGTFCLTFMLDVILEGIIWMPFGIYTYVGGHWPLLFPDSYHVFPAQQAITIGLWSTPVVFLYTFRNNKGQTLVERGVENLSGGAGKKALYSVLAMIAFFQIGFTCTYTVPNLAFWSSKPVEWPDDAKRRSYMVDNLCGAANGLACPGPQTPLNRGSARDQTGARLKAGAATGGDVIVPGDKRIPEVVPFSKEEHGAFAGPIIRIGNK